MATISLRELRAKIKADPSTKDMIRPSTKNSIYLDVDGDGPADFAIISSDLKGDTIDTFAVALTNSGDFDVYISNCLSEDAELIVYAIDSDSPKFFIPKGKATQFFNPDHTLFDLFSNFDGETFAKILKARKAMLVQAQEAGKFPRLSNHISLRELRAKMKASAEIKEMIRPSAKNEIFLDVDGDGTADFAVISSNPKGDTLDTLAVDLSNDGEFDLYIFNLLEPDKTELVSYDFDGDVPKFIIPVSVLPELKEYLVKIVEVYRNFNAETYVKVAKELKARIDNAYKAGRFKDLGD